MGKDTSVLKVALLTFATIFIMGYINGYALNTPQLGMLVTPQTGNVIQFGLNTANGNFLALSKNIALFLGFVGGVIFALLTQNIFNNKIMQFFYNWSCFALPYALYPVYGEFVGSHIGLLVLAFASGAGLGFFRKIFHLDINNAMATGNVRMLGVWFGEAYVKKARTEKQEVFTFMIFLICVLLFAGGAFCFAVANKLGMKNVMLVVFCLAPYILAPTKSE